MNICNGIRNVLVLQKKESEENPERKKLRMRKIVRYHMIFSGSVQAVGFRYRAFHAAGSLGVTGWVRNCDDGTVEVEAQGEPAEIRRMVDMIADSSYIMIEEVRAREIEPVTENGFYIRG